MFCSKCGQSIPEGSAFCTSCGSPLKKDGPAASPVPPYPNQWGYGAPQPLYPQRKKHTGLIAGIIAGVVLIAAAAVALFVWPGFLIGNDNALLGFWYNEDRAEAIEFKSSSVRVYTTEKNYKGEYEYDAAKARGVITVDENDVDFALTEDGLEVDGIGVYVKADDDFDADDFIKEAMAAMAPATAEPAAEPSQAVPADPSEAPTASIAAVSSDDILGLWYETTGYGGTLEFYVDGTYTMTMMGVAVNGTYEYDAVSGCGTIYEELSGTEYPLTISDGLLTIDSLQYTRDYVEQYDLNDLENAG